MPTAAELFENALAWLKERYEDYRFFQERDLVWVLQTRLAGKIASQCLPYRVFNDYGIIGVGRADLALLDSGDSVAVAAEFKYEPSHARNAKQGGDIWPTKFPVVFRDKDGSVEKDVQRTRNYVGLGKAKVAYSIFIDERGHFRARDPFPGSEWVDWPSGVSVLWSRMPPHV